jgi:hypothetical protein
VERQQDRVTVAWNTRFVPERALLSPPSTEAAGGNGAGRTVRRRRPLPDGRAVAGGLLVAVSAVGLFASWRSASAPPTSEYVVAARTIPVGTVLRPADVATVRLDLPSSLRRRTFADVDAVVGAEAVGAIEPGELVQASDLTAGTGTRAHQLSFSIEASRALDGAIGRGERVDVVATYGGGGGDSWTAVVASGALVADVSASGAALGSGRTLTVTLALERGDDVLAVTHAARAGAITIVRSGDGAGSASTYRPVPPDRARTEP